MAAPNIEGNAPLLGLPPPQQAGGNAVDVGNVAPAGVGGEGGGQGAEVATASDMRDLAANTHAAMNAILEQVKAEKLKNAFASSHTDYVMSMPKYNQPAIEKRAGNLHPLAVAAHDIAVRMELYASLTPEQHVSMTNDILALKRAIETQVAKCVLKDGGDAFSWELCDAYAAFLTPKALSVEADPKFAKFDWRRPDPKLLGKVRALMTPVAVTAAPRAQQHVPPPAPPLGPPPVHLQQQWQQQHQHGQHPQQQWQSPQQGPRGGARGGPYKRHKVCVLLPISSILYNLVYGLTCFCCLCVVHHTEICFCV
jgi:hypothetical protein